MKRLLQALLLLAAFGLAQSPSDVVEVTLVTPDGSQTPFTVDTRDGPTYAVYSSGKNGEYGTVAALVGGRTQLIPIEQLVRADLKEPGSETVWVFQLKDGRTFDGAVEESDARFYIIGQNEFGAFEEIASYPLRPDHQEFIGIIFDEAQAGRVGGSSSQPSALADVDTVNLRNGDVLSGEILTTDFAVQASYGTLSFTKDQLASISIESQDGRTDQVVLDVGDRVSGVLQNESIEITLTSGATVTLEKGNIGSITFATE